MPTTTSPFVSDSPSGADTTTSNLLLLLQNIATETDGGDTIPDDIFTTALGSEII